MACKESPGFRHELKYEIDYGTYLALKSRIGTVMKPDPHAGADGCYVIRSIYFDNMNDKALLEKIEGIQKREKFRIRYYNDDLSFITLEKKQKVENLCLKCQAWITKDECKAILDGQYDGMMKHESELVRELYCKMKSQGLRPRVIVSYMREPYIYNPGNVRITFDSNVRSTLWHPIFLEEETPDISALNEP